MPAFLSDHVLDNGLQSITSTANRIDLCSQQPTTYAEATSTYSLGNKTSVSVGSPTNGDSNGRKVVVPAITGGNITASGTATHWALVDTVNSRLLAAQALTASAAVVSGETFSLASANITIPDAA